MLTRRNTLLGAAALAFAPMPLVRSALAATTYGPNLVPNPGFETGTTAPANWSADYWGTLTPTFTYPVTGRNGSGKAAKVTVANWSVEGDAKWAHAPVPVTPGRFYRFTDYYISTVQTQLVAEYRNASGAVVSYVWLGDVMPAAGWTQKTVEFQIPAGVAQATVYHLLPGNGQLTVDDFALQLVTASGTAGGLITLAFDDGWRDQFQNARLILANAGIKATFYVMSEPTRNPSAYLTSSGARIYMNASEVRQLAQAGHEVGNHTKTHPHLPELSATAALAEIRGARTYLEGLVGAGKVRTFAYPYGERTQAIIDMVRSTGHQSARTVDGGFASIADPFQIASISPTRTTTLASVKSQIDQAIAADRWLVISLHRIGGSTDQYSNTKTWLQGLVNYIIQKGMQGRTVTVSQGFARLAQ